MNWKRGFGIGLMFVGVYLIVINGSITGNVIGFGESYGNNILGFLGIMIFLIGFFLIVATATIEDVVGTETKSDISVYDSMQGSKIGSNQDRFYLKDKGDLMLDIAGSHDVSLKDFQAAYDLIKDDKELLEKARNVYGSELYKIANEGTDLEENIALEFLEVLYEGNISPIESHGPIKIDLQKGLSNPQKAIIRSAFKGGWKGTPDKSQQRVLNQYNLEHIKTNNYGRIRFIGKPDNFVTTSNTPSDVNAGKNIGRDVIRLINNSDRD